MLSFARSVSYHDKAHVSGATLAWVRSDSKITQARRRISLMGLGSRIGCNLLVQHDAKSFAYSCFLSGWPGTGTNRPMSMIIGENV